MNEYTTGSAPAQPTKNTEPAGLFAGILFSVCGARLLVNLARSLISGYGVSMGWLAVLLLAAYATAAVGFFMDRNYTVQTVGVGLLTLYGLISVVRLLVNGAFSVYLLAQLLELGAAALLLLMVLPRIVGSLEQIGSALEKLWFLPAAVSLLASLIWVVTTGLSLHMITSVLFKLLFAAALLFAGMQLCCPELMSGFSAAASAAPQQGAGRPAAQRAAAPERDPDALNKLSKLKELYDAGVLTDEEFNQKREELLKRI